MHARDTTTNATLWWGLSGSQNSPGQGDALQFRARTFLGLVDPARMHTANGLISRDGIINEPTRNRIEHGLKKLAQNMDSGPGVDNEINPWLPSGYTYFLQFIGHDIIDSVPSFVVRSSSPARLVPRNARQKLLALDTIYGAGPDESSFAYHPSHSSDPTSPRDRLLLRELPRSVASTACCAFHDIGRISTDALLADPRNDAHAILAQLTALFHLLHNQIVTLLGEGEFHSRNEGIYRRFLCARAIVTLIYRNIIEKDVLRRILDPRVYEHYRHFRSDPSVVMDKEDGVPLEFSHGAIRFAHAMVRSNYMINSDTTQNTKIAILRTSQRQQNEHPLGSEWLVDWARFFDLEEDSFPERRPLVRAKINYSRKLGPRYTHEFAMQSVFPSKDPVEGQGLAYRDLRSALYAGMWSVPALCAELRRNGRKMVPRFETYKTAIAAWLARSGIVGDLAESIVNDPPMPFFVLFEAADSATDGFEGGERLGPVGSILVAEAICGALLRHPTGFEGSQPISARIERCCEALLGDPSALAVPEGRHLEIASMAQLLRFMAKDGVFHSGLL
jgi:hypothetical protein